jgi:hypothetical protein
MVNIATVALQIVPVGIGAIACESASTCEAVGTSGMSGVVVTIDNVAAPTVIPPPPPKIPLTRVFGSDRVRTAVAISQTAYPSNGSAMAVVLARDDQFPDALAGGPLAAKNSGPLLLTEPTSLDPAAKTEIQRVLPTSGTVYLLGGSLALSPSIDTTLQALGYHTQRLAGADRFATAVAIAQAIGDPTTIFEATGLNFPDALAAVPAAVNKSGAILLTNGATAAPETQQYLAQLSGTTRYALGGQAAAADPTATPLVGADRYATAVAVAQQFFLNPIALGAASAVSFPDALGAGPLLGRSDEPLLLLPSDGQLPQVVATYLGSISVSLNGASAFGGPDAVSDYTLQWVAGLG